MKSKEFKLFIIGYGNIARNLLSIIQEYNVNLIKNYGIELKIEAIADTRGVYAGFENIHEIINAKLLNYTDKYMLEDEEISSAIKNLDYDILVEVSTSTNDGQPGISYVKSAIKNKKDVVIANKGILVNDFSLIDFAKSNGIILKFESTVCGSIPVFNSIDNYYSKGKILKMEGAFNATSSYVIQLMERGMDFYSAIRDAISNGIAEKNYNEDLYGVDSGRKALILHNYVYEKRLNFRDINFDIKESDISPGKRLLSEITEGDITIKYVNKSEKNKIFDFNGAGMSFSIKTDLFNEQTIIVENDGPKESAGAVYSDIMDIVKVRKNE